MLDNKTFENKPATHTRVCRKLLKAIKKSAIPKYFYESLSRRVLENGLVARCIIVEAGSRGKGKMAMPITPSDSLLRAAKYLVNLDLAGNLSHQNPKPLIISETPEATMKIKELQVYCDEHRVIKQCPVSRISAGEVEQAVLSQIRVILQSDLFIEQCASKLGVERDTIFEMLNPISEFWDEMAVGERYRLMTLLVDKAVILNESLEIELKISGISKLTERLQNAKS